MLDTLAGVPERLLAAMRYSTLGGGKRLRPAMLLFSNQMFQETPGAALLSACAIELVHTYSLIHDDLPAMDDDDERRGKPSLHRAFDEATAVLAGDGLLTLAFEVMARAGREYALPADVIVEAILEIALAAGVQGMVAGQMLDMIHGPSSNVTDVLRIHDSKTGSMFVASLRLGALLGGCSAESLKAITDYGRHFGRLYQVADDLSDLGGNGSECMRASYPRVAGVTAAKRHATEQASMCLAALSSFGDCAWWLVDLVKQVLSKVVDT